MPKLSSGERALIARSSSRSTFASSRDRPPPPYSFGHVGAVQPRSAMRSSQRFWSSDLKFQLRPPQQRSSSSSRGRRIKGGQLLASHARVSLRNVSRSVIFLLARKQS